MAVFGERRIARKRHVPGTPTGGCETCRGPIEPGEPYDRPAVTPEDDDAGNQSNRWAHIKVHAPSVQCWDRPVWKEGAAS